MLRYCKLVATLLLVTAAGAALGATTYTYVTKKVTLADGSVVSQRWQTTFVDSKPKARDMVSQTVLSGPTVVPVVTYTTSTAKVSQPDGSVVAVVTRTTFTDGKKTASTIVSSSMISPPTPIPVVTYAYVTTNKTLANGSVVAEQWKYTSTDGKLTAKDLASTTVVTPAPVVVAPVITYNYVTKNLTQANGSVVSERWQYTFTNGKMTAKDIVSTTSTASVTVAPVVAPVTNIANYNPATYYNNTNIGTPTAGVSNNPAYYLTAEANKTISAIGANYAYARGWTGAGSTILIMDTGISLASPKFAGKIKYSIDYTKTGIQDNVGHGSQVASIAAGAMTGAGMYGVAFDANLAIAKITNNTSVDTASARKALLWAQQYTDIVVANLSANTTYSTSYRASVSKLIDNTYYSNDPVYGGAKYYNLEKPSDWSNVLGKEMVLVVAAGNQGLQYVQSPAVFASATDANGKLLMNGQMLIAGGWNTTTNTLYGNGAGTVCKVVVGGSCKDAYRTSDFFLLAPAVAITSVNANGTYTSSSGTSFAAPAISGAVAVVHQLWPYMEGAKLAQLLLKTANKNLPNYDVNVMGQGLLDLDKATQPVGNLGISVTGRTGVAVPLSGSLSIAGGVDATVSSAVSNVSAVDSLQRDFTVNLSGATRNMIQPVAYMNQSPGQSWSGRYVGMGNSVNGVSASGYGSNYSFSLSTQAFSKTYQPLQYQATVTNLDTNPWINFSGVWGQSRNSSTTEVSALYSPEPVGAWGQAGLMTTTGVYNYGMVTNVSAIRSAYAMAGWRNKNINLYGGIKPTVFSGSASLTVPTSVDSSGVMQYSSVTSRIRNQSTGFVGANYEYIPFRNHSMNFLATVGQDRTGQIGVRYSVSL
jgi:hypothetical protein